MSMLHRISVQQNINIKKYIKMGNNATFCHNNTSIQTQFRVQKASNQQIIKQNVTVSRIVLKTVKQFIQKNADFFSQKGAVIAQFLISRGDLGLKINKFPIQRTKQYERIFLPDFTAEQFTIYKGQCLLLNFKSGQLYLGSIIDGKKQGFGVLIDTKGNNFEGIWEKDLQNGSGVFKILYPKRTYKGTWKNGKLEGQGEVIYQDGANYQGHFYQGKKHGFGILKFFDGAVYEGSFQNDLMHGFGTLTTTKGRQIIGQWKQGKYQQPIRLDRSSKTFSINQLSII